MIIILIKFKELLIDKRFYINKLTMLKNSTSLFSFLNKDIKTKTSNALFRSKLEGFKMLFDTTYDAPSQKFNSLKGMCIIF